jgi:hypothetical protein
MASWQKRLRPSITFVSPLGQNFEAAWRGDDITLTKRVNRIAHPDQDGESSQDMGLNSPDLPLTFFFSGANHDAEALRFSRAIAERGTWRISHPVYGILRLQPVKITIRVQPMESGNITEVSGDWFLTDLSVQGQTAPDPAAAVESAAATLFERALSDAAQISSKIAASAAAAQSAATQFRKGLDAVKGVLRSANARITAIMGTINDLTMQAYLDVASLSGAVIQLCESPGLFAGSVAARVSMFVRLGRRIITDLPSALSFSHEQVSAALTGELWLNAISCGLGTTITASLPETRTEALSILSQYRAFAAESLDALDALAKTSASWSIETQYFPRFGSAEAILTLNAAVSRYITGVAFDLKTEKRIVLVRPENPMMIAIREYGANSSNADYYFGLLCRSNNLHGKELLLLDSGREVVVYA